MSWYDPTYGYAPDELADDLGLDVVPTDEIGPDTRPLAVYAGAFRPAATTGMATVAETTRTLVAIDQR